MTHSNDNIAEVFDDWAATHRAQQMADGHQFAAKDAFVRLDVKPGQRCLDIGCGLGYSVRWAAAVDASVHAIGVDVSKTMVTKARSASALVPNAQFFHGIFPDVVSKKQFDRIFSVEALYYLPDLQQALRDVFEHLAAGGRFVTVIDYYEENKGCHNWSKRVGVPLVMWSIEQWVKGMSEAGFIDVESFQLLHPPNDGPPSWQQKFGTLIISANKLP